MNEYHSILLQKEGESIANDSIERWGIACCAFPFKLDGGAKDLASRDWPGESGEDTFFPSKLSLKPYDLQLDLVYIGGIDSAYSAIMSFRDYLTGEDGTGTNFSIYNSYTGIGRNECRWLEMGDIKYYKDENEDILVFPMKIRVSNPEAYVAPIWDDHYQGICLT